jgi:hypothetical protein
LKPFRKLHVAQQSAVSADLVCPVCIIPQSTDYTLPYSVRQHVNVTRFGAIVSLFGSQQPSVVKQRLYSLPTYAWVAVQIHSFFSLSEEDSWCAAGCTCTVSLRRRLHECMYNTVRYM